MKYCRNPVCTDNVSCLCDESPSGELILTPAGGDTQLGGGRQISLTVSSFTDGSGQSNATPTLKGFTEPDAKVTISVFPDGVGTTVTADSSGRWTWQPTKPLSAGRKNLLVVVTKDTGQGHVAQAFTVVAGARTFSMGTLVLIVLVLAVAGGAVFLHRNPR